MSKQQKIEDTPLLDGEAGKQGTKRKAEESGAQEDKEAAPPTKDAKSDGVGQRRRQRGNVRRALLQLGKALRNVHLRHSSPLWYVPRSTH